MWNLWGDLDDFPHQLLVPPTDYGKTATSPRSTHSPPDVENVQCGRYLPYVENRVSHEYTPSSTTRYYSLRKVIRNNIVERF